MDFKEALAYLQSTTAPDMTSSRLYKEIRNDPERFGAQRRNPTKKRGRGGKLGFPKRFLDAYESYAPVVPMSRILNLKK